MIKSIYKIFIQLALIVAVMVPGYSQLPQMGEVIQESLPDTVKELHPLEWEYVKQEERIAFLLHAHREAAGSELGVNGYRVHIYMDSGNRARLNTQRAQTEFEEIYPEQNSYIIYEEPYFKLRAGDFRTRLDARRFLEKIREEYPSAYIVVDRINFPEMD